MDKTIKIRAYSGEAKGDLAQGNLADDKNKSLELAMKDAQIEEEQSRSLEHLKTIVHLRESLKQEQARTVELLKRADEFEAKLKALASLEAGELATRNVQVEEEKNKSLEHLKTIEQLRENLKQEQAKTAEMAKRADELQARTKSLETLQEKVNEIPLLEARIRELAALEIKIKEMAALEAKVKELGEALGKISSIAAAGKVV